MSGTFGGGGDDNGGFLSGLINTLGNPETFGMLSGLTRGAAMAAMPSRMPIPTGAALGLAASGLQEGRNQALQGQLVKQQGIASQLGNIGTAAQLPVLLSRAHMLQQIYSDPNLMRACAAGIGGSSAPMGVPSMGQSPVLLCRQFRLLVCQSGDDGFRQFITRRANYPQRSVERDRIEQCGRS